MPTERERESEKKNAGINQAEFYCLSLSIGAIRVAAAREEIVVHVNYPSLQFGTGLDLGTTRRRCHLGV